MSGTPEYSDTVDPTTAKYSAGALSPAYTDLDAYPSSPSSWWTSVSYKGAFGDSLADGDMWLAGWSWLVAQDKLSQRSSGGGGNDGDELEPWEIALIVVACVLGAALIGGVMFVIGNKQGINTGYQKAKDEDMSGMVDKPIDIEVPPGPVMAI